MLPRKKASTAERIRGLGHSEHLLYGTRPGGGRGPTTHPALMACHWYNGRGSLGAMGVPAQADAQTQRDLPSMAGPFVI